MRVAICMWGLARSTRYTYESFESNILSPLRKAGAHVDLFVHALVKRTPYTNAGSHESGLDLSACQRDLQMYPATQLVNLIDRKAFPMPANLITDANLGLGVTGFVRRDPSQPTSDEKEILQRNHSATYTSRPMVITQEPQFYNKWQEFNTRVSQRRYRWIVSGLKKRDQG